MAEIIETPSVPKPDAELVRLAWDRLNELEDDRAAVHEFADVITSLATEVAQDQPKLAMSILRIAREIDARADAIDKVFIELWQALHPHRGEPGFADHGNAEVEEAAGEV